MRCTPKFASATFLPSAAHEESIFHEVFCVDIAWLSFSSPLDMGTQRHIHSRSPDIGAGGAGMAHLMHPVTGIAWAPPRCAAFSISTFLTEALSGWKLEPTPPRSWLLH